MTLDRKRARVEGGDRNPPRSTKPCCQVLVFLGTVAAHTGRNHVRDVAQSALDDRHHMIPRVRSRTAVGAQPSEMRGKSRLHGDRNGGRPPLARAGVLSAFSPVRLICSITLAGDLGEVGLAKALPQSPDRKPEQTQATPAQPSRCVLLTFKPTRPRRLACATALAARGREAVSARSIGTKASYGFPCTTFRTVFKSGVALCLILSQCQANPPGRYLYDPNFTAHSTFPVVCFSPLYYAPKEAN